jgi:hypothetical protein
MRRYILIALSGLGLLVSVPGQAKADEEYSVGPVTIYRHHSPEWYRERERLRRREWRERHWREHEWREHEWQDHHWREYPDRD